MIETARKAAAVALGAQAVGLGLAFIVAVATDPSRTQGLDGLLVNVGLGLALVSLGVWFVASEFDEASDDVAAVEAGSEAASRSETA